MLGQAINFYHSLLDHTSAQENQRLLDSAQRQEGLFFGERPLSTVLRPRLLTHHQYQYLCDICSQIARSSRQVIELTAHDPRSRQLMAFTPGEERLLQMEPGYNEPSASARLDSFFDNETGSLQFVEYNAESPAAIAYEDVLSQVFLDLPIMNEFARSYAISPLPARQHMLQALLMAFKEWGRADEPQIAIIDWKGLPTHSEFVLFQQYFTEQGFKSIICAPEDLTYQQSRLYAQGQPINLVYKRVLTSEFLQHFGSTAFEHPLIQAYRDGTICLVNNFRGKLLHKKMLFGLLSDPEILANADIDAQTQAMLMKHIPWTRRVQAGHTTYQHNEVDLLPFIIDQQNQLLLKPNDEYGGKGITIGWETSSAEWKSAVEAALKEPFVVQERVHIAYEDYPAYDNGQLTLTRRLVDTDPFLFGTTAAGCLTRLSTVTLLNVTAGGGSTVPTFLIAEKTA